MAIKKIDAALGGQASGTLYEQAFPSEEKKSAKEAADAGLYGALAGMITGAQPGKTPTAEQPEKPQPQKPTGGGGGGGNQVTYIDENGDAQKGTTEAEEPQKTYLDDLRNQYQKMYADAVAANEAAAKAAAERSAAQIEGSIGELGTSYGNLNKQLYRDYMESLRVLPQEMAARGYSGGMSESARLGLDTAYGERLNENEAARLAAIADLRQQGADAEHQANAARDQANAQAQQNLYANLANLILQQQQDDANRAQNMAQYGDFSGYLKLGYTQEQIDAMKKAWIAANPEMAQALGCVSAPSYRSYGGGGKTKVDPMDLVREAIDLKRNGALQSDIETSLDGEAKDGNISQDQADAIKRISVSQGMEDAWNNLKGGKK